MTSTKLALITDLHFGVKNDSSIFIEYFKKFYDNQFFPYLKQHSINTVVILGDSFDRRKYTNHKIIKAARETLFDKLEDNEIETHILVGNHDSCFKNSIELNTLDLLLSHYKNINIIEKPQTINFGHDIKVAMIPWICQDNYVDSIHEISTTKAEILMGHLEIAGFEFHRGEISKEGLSTDLFKRFDYVLSGHYHHRSTKGNITYLGVPYEMTWQDYNDPKGFHIFDLETRTLEFIENTNKMFVRLEYNDKDVTNRGEFIRSLNISELKDKIVKLVVVNKTDYYLFDTVINELHQAGCFDFKIIESMNDLLSSMNIVSENEEDSNVEINLEDTQSILLNYVDTMSLNDSIDRQKLSDFIRALYLEALTEETL